MPEQWQKKEGYTVSLPNFEGPLDLLLYLIRKEEIDIVDIPIASITSQYLEYVELMKELDLEVAGEFILMAATLIQIKVRMLLPKTVPDGDEELEDPRAELVRQLLEYKRFKEVAETLNDKEDRQRRYFARCDFAWARQYIPKEETASFDRGFMNDVSLFDLLTAFKTVLDNAPGVTSHQLSAIGVTVEDQIHYVLGMLEKESRIPFHVMMNDLRDRVTIIVTFMAVLELIRTKRLHVQQAGTFGDIWLIKQ